VLDAIILNDFIVIALHPSYPQLLPIAIDEVFSNNFEASQMEREMPNAVLSMLVVLPDCQADGILRGFRLKFDKQGAFIENNVPSGSYTHPEGISPALKFSLVVSGSIVRCHFTTGSFRMYDVFMHIKSPLHSQFPSTSLDVRAGVEELRYNTYPAEFGIIGDVVWFTTIDMMRPVLYMSKNAGVPWPVISSGTVSIDLVDLEVGVACCFSDSTRMDDPYSEMEITWFRELNPNFGVSR
jgi:hypothetical protein